VLVHFRDMDIAPLRILARAAASRLAAGRRGVATDAKHGTGAGPVQAASFGAAPLYTRAEKHRGRVAVCDQDGSFVYEDLYRRSHDLAAGIVDVLKAKQRRERCRVAFLCPNGASYVITQWAVWMAGHVAVPLDKGQREATLEHCVHDADADLVIAAASQVDKLRDLCKRTDHPLISLDHTWTAKPKRADDFNLTAPLPAPLAESSADSDALILYGYESNNGKHS